MWLSPHTIVVPGKVKPCSGPMMWHDALALVELVEIVDAEILGVLRQRGDLLGAFRIGIGLASGPAVGTL